MADLDIALGHLLNLLLQANLCIEHSYKSRILYLHTFSDLAIHAQGIPPLTAHKKLMRYSLVMCTSISFLLPKISKFIFMVQIILREST